MLQLAAPSEPAVSVKSERLEGGSVAVKRERQPEPKLEPGVKKVKVER